MPELPEAEMNRAALERECLNRTIESAEPGENTKGLDLPGANERQRLVGNQFTRTKRHGKLVFAGSKSGSWICVHLGMTGQLIPYDEGDGPPDKAKFLIAFEGDRRLAFRCPRKLGWLRVIDDPDEEIERLGFGPDALSIDRDTFTDLIGNTYGAVKSALMNQHKLAGIGNLWSDEILFQTGIRPERKASELDAGQLRDMHKVMRDKLDGAVRANADYSKLPDTWLVRNRKKGGDCPRCDGKIANRTVGGRTAYYCTQHQN